MPTCVGDRPLGWCCQSRCQSQLVPTCREPTSQHSTCVFSPLPAQFLRASPATFQWHVLAPLFGTLLLGTADLFPEDLSLLQGCFFVQCQCPFPPAVFCWAWGSYPGTTMLLSLCEASAGYNDASLSYSALQSVKCHLAMMCNSTDMPNDFLLQLTTIHD